MHLQRLNASKVLDKAERLSIFGVVQIMFVRIGLLFEAYCLIPPVKAKAQKTSNQPLGDVNNIEGYNQQFQLLLQMNFLMIDKNTIRFQRIVLENNEGPDGKANVVFVEKMFKD
jgi:hypothetical protein